MTDVISDYQRWKQQGESLRTQAKQAMENRFREIFAEAVQIAEMYKADFGGPLKPPPQITAFKFKASGKSKAKKPAPKAKAAATAPPPAPAAPAKPDPKLAALQKKLANAKKKLDDAKAAAAPTRALEDRVYEIEDELRLLGQ